MDQLKLSYCLLCGDGVNDEPSKLGGIVGGFGCILLERQLEKMFILVKILEVPKYLCEEILKRGGGDEEDDGGDGLDKWFNLCDKCVEGNVSRAWLAYQNILKWQSNMLSEKLKILEGMRGSVLKDKQEENDGQRILPTQVECEIKRYLFPELFTKVEQLELDEGDHHDDQNDHQPEMEVTFKEVPSKLKPAPKRSRGRPLGSLGRRTRHPGTYYYQGTLKTKRFHWSICTICDARYPNTEDYTAHMALHSQRDTDPTSKGPLDCPHCPFPARDPQELDYHLLRRHLPKRPKLQQNYSCPKCPGFTTLRWKYFRSHVDISHPTVPLSEFGPSLTLKCPDCDKQHVNILQYQRHRNKEHPQDILKGPPVSCRQCDTKFISQSLLTKHVNSTHKRASRHICDECGKGFEFGNALRKHKEGHLIKKGGALKRKREHVCEICGMDFYYEDTYKKHYKKQHGGDGGLRAPSSKVLEAPELYQCKYCDLRSGLKTYIKRHIQEEHKDQMGYQCDKCERRYTNKQGLRRHERLNHGGREGEVPCPHCGKRFKGVEYMKDHVKKFCKLKQIPCK